MQTETHPPMAETSQPGPTSIQPAYSPRPHIEIRARLLRDSKGKAIADREVWVNGEHRGTFQQEGKNTFLTLCLLNGHWARRRVPNRFAIGGFSDEQVRGYIHSLHRTVIEALDDGTLPTPAEQRANDAAEARRRQDDAEACRRRQITFRHLGLIQEAIIEAIDTLEVIDGNDGNADALIAKLYRAKQAALGIEPDALEAGAA